MDLSVRSPSNFENIKYIELKEYNNLPFLRIASMDQFLSLVKQNNINTLFVYKYEKDRVKQLSDFIFLKDGYAFATNAYGFENIGDYLMGTELGFGGKSSNYRIQNERLVEPPYWGEQISDGFLFYNVMKLGYKDYSEFRSAYEGEFYENGVSVKEFRKVRELGFHSFSDYKGFKDSKLNNVEDYLAAKKLDIDDPETYRVYKELKSIRDKLDLDGFDQCIAYAVISANTSKILTVDSIVKMVEGIESKFTDDDYDELPRWFKTKYAQNRTYGYRTHLINSDKVVSDLSKNPIFLKMGRLNTLKTEFIKYLGVPLFIDGSNVAYNNSDKKDGSKPLAKYIRLVAEEAKEYNFSDIRIYNDANLEHLVQDIDVLVELKKEFKVEKVPGGTDADDFIIAFAKKNEGFIVTNDRFRDYIESHPDDKEFIRDHRISFMVDEDGTVVFNDDKRITNLPTISDTEIKSLFSLFRK